MIASSHINLSNSATIIIQIVQEKALPLLTREDVWDRSASRAPFSLVSLPRSGTHRITAMFV